MFVSLFTRVKKKKSKIDPNLLTILTILTVLTVLTALTALTVLI